MNTNPDRDTLRQRIAEVMALRHNGPASDGRGWFRDEEQRQALLAVADAVLAVLPDRAAILTEVAELAERLMDERYGPDCSYAIGGLDVARELRRLAAEAPTTTKPPGVQPRHTCHDQKSAPGWDWECQWCSTLPDDISPAAGVRQDGAQP
ncbi:MAG: hypothetical protein HOY76_02855 [Streptomyces sp.]|nr:hypothetical protein [Streptomyces sp.]